MKQLLDEVSKKALVNYRINRAKETIEEVKSISESGYYNTAINRLYYACYYAVIALLVKNNIETQTHAGVKQMLGLHFVSTKKLDADYSKFYSQIFNNRITGDYDDFVVFDKEMLDELIPKAEDFIYTIEKLIV
jgi:uncharacterized protein (UPF0332 family)